MLLYRLTNIAELNSKAININNQQQEVQMLKPLTEPFLLLCKCDFLFLFSVLYHCQLFGTKQAIN